MCFNCTVETFNQNAPFFSAPPQHFPTPPLRWRWPPPSGASSLCQTPERHGDGFGMARLGGYDLDASPPNPINRKSIESKLKRPRAVDLARTCRRNREYQSQDKGVDSAWSVKRGEIIRPFYRPKAWEKWPILGLRPINAAH